MLSLKNLFFVGDDKTDSQENGVNSITDDPSLPTFKIPNIGPKEMKLNPPSTKNPLKLIMNPHGQLQDIQSLAKQGLNVQTPLSPELCFDLVRDLNTTKGKGMSTSFKFALKLFNTFR